MEFIDLKAQYRFLQSNIDKKISAVIEGAKFIGGTEVTELEEKLGKYTGRKYCISCASGTDALQLAYMAIGIGKGDAIFCPDMTFIASVEPASLLGATPIFVDIDIESYNIDPVILEKRIREVKKEGILTPKVVVAVDFLGNPADIKRIKDICKKYDMYLIEDAAQSMGASLDGIKCCAMGDIACTSFFPSKPLGCYGDGGAVFTDSDEMAEIMRSIKVHGKGKSKYDNVRIGMNSRLDTIQAAVLLAKLSVLDFEIEKRQVVAKKYDETLQDIVMIPKVGHKNISSYAQYCVLFESINERTYVEKKMKENDIPSLIYYPNPLHRLVAFKNVKKYNQADFNNTEKYASCNLGLPFSPYILEEDQGKVIDIMHKSVREFRAYKCKEGR